MKRLGDLLANLFDGETLEKAKGYASIFSCWKDLTEKNHIASAFAHSRIASLDNRLIWIEVDHPGWKQIIQTKERKLLYDFRLRFPKMNFSGICIMLQKPNGEGRSPDSVEGQALPEEKADGRESSAETVGDSGINYEGIKDEVLKKTLMRLEKEIARKNSSG